MINWVGFISTAIVVSAIPGANQLLGLRNAVRYGTARAMRAVSGRLGAFAVFIGLIVFGLGAALTASAEICAVIKWVGVVYLLWIGLTTLYRSFRQRELGDGPPPMATGRLLRQEFVVAITNPEAVLFFGALLPQFAGSGQVSPAAQLAVLGVVYLVIETIVALGYTVVGGQIGGKGTIRGGMRRRLDQLTGMCFLALAGYLLAASI